MSQPQLDFEDGVDDEAIVDPEGTYTVGELAEVINRRIRGGEDGVWVRGEIQGWNARGPHAYFTLADDAADTPDAKAVIDVAVFAPSRNRLRPMLERHRLRLGDGIKVRIYGYLDFYAPRGQIKLVMTGIDPRFTLGDLAQQRDQVMRRLVAGGLVDANRRTPLGRAPVHVGVVTSVGSAAWHDFHQELAASGLGFQLSVCDVRVQGDHAVAMVAAAIVSLAARPLDAIVVIRGGGARNELSVFDAESIALAIAGSPVPVLTGLGHEVDRSIADEVAYASYKTPTACAQALVGMTATYLAEAERAYERVLAAARDDTERAATVLADRAHRIARRTQGAVVRAEEGLAQRRARLHSSARRALGDAASLVERAAARTRVRPPQVLTAESRHLESLHARARALDPVVMLARGWTITRHAGGAVVRSPLDVVPGDVLVTQLAAGSVTSTVAATSGTPEPDRSP